MAFEAFYTITDWQNLPSQRTALGRTNLLHLENGVKEADIRIVQLDASKLSMELANTLVKSVNVDAKLSQLLSWVVLLIHTIWISKELLRILM